MLIASGFFVPRNLKNRVKRLKLKLYFVFSLDLPLIKTTMKKPLLVLATALLLAVAGIFFVEKSDADREAYRRMLAEHPFTLREKASPDELKKIDKRDRPDLAWEQDFLATMDPSEGRPTPERLLPIYQQVAAFRNSNTISTPGASTTPWVERGPTNVGGRTRTIMYDPTDATNKKVWAGGVTGGLWYNDDITDATSNWQAVDDFWANLAISAMAYDPVNPGTFYVGTGEGWGAGSGRGAGVWKSIDTGSTWTQLSATDDFYYVNDLIVRNESGNGVLYVATRGNYYQGAWHASAQSGLHRSTNGGTSFTQVLPNVPGQTFSYAAADLELAANNRLWVSTQPASYGGADRGGGRIMHSDNGTSFTVSYASPNGERVEISCAPSDANYVYGLVESSNVVSEIVKTSNNGATWTSVNEPSDADSGIPSSDFSRGQAWYDLIIKVHPTNAQRVYVGGIDLFMSSNGGTSWDQLSHWYGGFGYPYVHADQHQMVFNPGNSDELLFGNDGGVFRTTNATSSSMSFTSLNRNYNVTQFYSCAIHPTAGSHYALAGTQDNGTQQFSTAGLGSTFESTGGDGGFCFIDQTDPTYQVTSYVYNSYWRSTDGGASFGSRIQSDQSTGRFINPTDYDDHQDALYSARTSSTINRIRNLSGSYIIDDITVSGMSDMASHLRVSPYTTSSSTVFVGTDAGTLFKVTNADGTPSSTSIGAGLPAGNISCVEIGASENELLVTISNYGVTSIWYTNNGGSTWVDKEGNLPDMPVRWALFNPLNRNEVILATEVGVWETSNFNASSPTWSPSNSGLANVRVDMLQIRDSDREVIAATYGRGLFTSSGFQQQVAPMANFGANKLTACVNETVSLVDSSTGGITGYSWTINPNTFNYVNGTSSTSANPEVEFTATGLYTIDLTVSNSVGSDTKSRVDFISVGGQTLPFMEDFESGASGWTVSNPDGAITWGLYNTGGTSPGSISVGVDNYNYNASGERDGLISPALDFSGLSSVNLDFEYAYRRYSSSLQDSLAVYISTDCGLSYTLLALYQEDGTGNFATGSDFSGQFSPSASTDWCGGSNPVCPTINLDAYAGLTGVKIMFENRNGYGNNMFIDNVNLTGVNNGNTIAGFTAASTSFCEGSSTVFTDQSTNSPTAWAWTVTPSTGVTFINGSSSSSQHPEISFANAGSYTVSLDATNALNTDTETKSNYITVNAPITPSVSIGASQNNVCVGTNITFTATPTNGGSAPSYNWMVNGSSVLNGPATYSTTSLADGDVVTCEITNGDACVSTCCVLSNSITMNFTSPVTPSVSATASASTICAGESVNFNATGVHLGSSPMYQWKLNGNNVGTNSSSYTNSSLVNGDVVLVEVTSSETCVTSATATSSPITMTVNSLPVISLTPSTTDDLCNGDVLTVSASPAGGSFVWSSGGTTGSLDADLVGSGMHTLTYNYTDGNGCSNSSTLQANVILLPIPTISQGVNVIECNQAGFSYQWFNSSGPIPGATNQQYSPTANGDYTVQISQGDCMEESAPFTVTGIHLEEWSSVRSVEIYPVPASEKITLNIDALFVEDAQFELVDMFGKVHAEMVQQLNVGLNQIEINTSALPSGYYMLRAIGPNGSYNQAIEIIH